MHTFSYEFFKISWRVNFVSHCEQLLLHPAGVQQVNLGWYYNKIISFREYLLTVQFVIDCGCVPLHRGVKRCQSRMNLKRCLREIHMHSRPNLKWEGNVPE